MAYRVVIPKAGMVLGVFASEFEAYECYKKHYSTATDLCPTIEEVR